MKELAFNVVTRNGRPPALRGIFATLQPQGVLEPLGVERGDHLAFVAGFGTPRQVTLGWKTCKSAAPAQLSRDAQGGARLVVDGLPLLPREIHWIAIELGYASAAALLGYFEKTYGLPFNGTLLRW